MTQFSLLMNFDRAAKKPVGRRDLLRGMLAMGAAAMVPKFAQANDAGHAAKDFSKDAFDINTLDDPVEFLEEFDSSLENIIEIDSKDLIKRLQKHSPFTVADISRRLSNKKTGESVRFLYGEEGEFATLYEVEPSGFIPFEHAHEDEEEDFQLLSGEFTLYLNGVPTVAHGGETVKVPKETWHYGYNHGDKPARFFVNFANKENQYTGRDTFQAYWILCDLGYVSEDGKPDPLKMLRLTSESKSVTKIKGIPALLQNTADFFVDKTTRNVLRPRNRT
jgi:quercetin dioxygenase-like cupin family protein